MTPEISIVMSVYNGATALSETLNSILSQEGTDFEFIVINDGSTDGSAVVLDEWATDDARLRVIHQANTGLTRALIAGCALARGEFIARQDCGDVSLPGRLTKQLHALQAQPDAVAVSCDTRFIGPRGESLYTAKIDEAALNQGLTKTVDGVLKGPSHHGSVMMRRSAYERAGGYRSAFYFAQDLDLWTRLAEIGRFAVVPSTLYLARLDARSISATQTAEQCLLAELITAATRGRRAGKPETPHLEAAAAVSPVHDEDRAQRVARGNYFIGSCLRRNNPAAAARYFGDALNSDPWLWRARLRHWESLLRKFF